MDIPSNIKGECKNSKYKVHSNQLLNLNGGYLPDHRFFSSCRTFNRSHPHGSRALLAIDEYLGIHKMINKTLKLVQQANNTLNNITKEVSNYCIRLSGLF